MEATDFLSKVIGLLLVCLAVSIILQPSAFVKVLDDLLADRTPLYLAGVALLLAGLTIVLTHNIWNLGLRAAVISLIGWVLILRGLASMFVPGDDIARLVRWMKFEGYPRAYGILMLCMGGYLAWAGFANPCCGF
jgi:hypothetical protein